MQVLKNHGLFGLNEAQLRILLLQNDPCLLPEVCLLYNKGEALYGYCNLKDKCNKFHVCKSFVKGECKLQTCKRSHQLIHAASLKLLQDQGLNIPSVVNFQIISTYKHMKLHKMLENTGNSSSSTERSQGLEKQGVHTAGAAEAGPLTSVPAQSAKKPCPVMQTSFEAELKSKLPPQSPLESSSHGSLLPCGRGPQQGPQGNQECEQAQPQSLPRPSDQTHQVCVGHEPGGVWHHPIQAARHGVTEGLQGQMDPQVHQEKGGEELSNILAAVKKAAAKKE
ncbi:hypothetical protein P7K49_025746 [Saguinus oedipus]|uniref:Zinc finger CCCH-type containing, antiviral 1 like n=1 Tax=Saguinus oedipus TaxID=9490 RepID=A0ABQ9UKC5_SAGOE|nr:hypothetical protein P7K49_025746 [Saguinus oedipus]